MSEPTPTRATVDGDQTPQAVKEILDQHGLRCTRQRRAVYQALCKCNSHPTADELYQIVLANEGDLSLATVYNTLNALADAGLVRRLPGEAGICRFDADLSDHIHIRYRETGQVMDLPAPLAERFMSPCCQEALGRIAAELGIDIDGISIEIAAKRRPHAAGDA